MLVIITTNTILITEKLSQPRKYWGELNVRQRMWKKWKTTYCVAEKKARIKKKSDGGKYQFGAAHSEMQQPATIKPGVSPARDAHTMSLEVINGYFNKLVAAAANNKLVLEDLVANITTLTTSNMEMADTIKTHWQKLVASATPQQFPE